MIRSALAILLFAIHPSGGQAINISGTVKNPSGNPISGAHILLENANLADTTGSDGAFLIQSPGTRLNPGSATHPSGRLSAGFHSGVLTVAAAEGSRVSIRVFSQLGQELFSGDYPAAASVKAIGIEGIGTEKVLVRIRSGAHSLAVQGHARQGSIQARISGVSAAALKKGLPAIPDSLVITKEGFLRKAVHLATSDTSGLEIRMTGSAGKTSGKFRVILVRPTSLNTGYTALAGALYAGPSPVPRYWTEVGKSGSCTLLKPNPPFCENPCGATAMCVANNICEDFPASISAGTVTVKGVKTAQGATQFTATPLHNLYQGPLLAYPPFAEGDEVSVSVPGDSGIAPFAVSAIGIRPLEVLRDSIFLADGQPMVLDWVSPSLANASTVSVLLDLSFHGGTRGKIECEGPDSGRLEIAAALVAQLKALGVSGYPKAEITRKSIGTHAESGVDLVLESPVRLTLSVPGLISCSDDGGCPAGQTCQADLQCK